MNPGNSQSSDLEIILRDSLIECLFDQNRHFVPEGTFSDDVFTRERIYMLVKAIDTASDSQFDTTFDGYTSAIQKNRKKLLTILTLGNFRRRDIIQEILCKFVDLDITDDDLPFHRYDQTSRNIYKLCSRKHVQNPKRRPIVMVALQSLDRFEVREFSAFQWTVLAATFPKKARLDDNTPPHFEFDENVLLPFMQLEGRRLPKKRLGGYSCVESGWICAGHQQLLAPIDDASPLIAIKKLHSEERRDFELEADMLASKYIHGHQNIIELLATYRHKGAYHLLFPYAHSNLREFWASVDQLPPRHWILDQMTGLSSAITAIHQQKSNPAFVSVEEGLPGLSRFTKASSMRAQYATGEERFGRHGDLKPENILWRKEIGDKYGRLQITDFGLGRFHRLDSRSLVDPLKIAGSATYMPPEVWLGTFISRKYDIWSLGCLFLEFMVWAIEGSQGLHMFNESRIQMDLEGNDDDFYFTLFYKNGRLIGAKVKDSVSTYMSYLKEHEHCSPAFKRIILLLETRLLVVDPSSRATAFEIYKALKYISEQDATHTDEPQLHNENPSLSVDKAQLASSHPSKLDTSEKGVVDFSADISFSHLSPEPKANNFQTENNIDSKLSENDTARSQSDKVIGKYSVETLPVRENLLAARDSAIGTSEGSVSTALKPDTSTGNDSGFFNGADSHNMDNEDDFKLVPSISADIQSQVSTKRSWQYELASIQIGNLLARNSQLGPLYKVALSKVGKKRFVDNLRNLLKTYYLDLLQNTRSNLELASIYPLRNRSNRIRIAQQISEIVDPESVDDPEFPVSEVPDGKGRLEDWIANNLGFMGHQEEIKEEISKETGKDPADNPSDSKSEGDSDSDEGIEKVFPNIAELEKFFLDAHSFPRLLANLENFVFVASSPLTAVLSSIPRKDIWFSKKDDTSITNKFKIAVENMTKEDWQWWPMRPKMRMLRDGETRVHWRCGCGAPLWAELLDSQASAYEALIAQWTDSSRDGLSCTLRTRESSTRNWLGWMKLAVGWSSWFTSSSQAADIPLHNRDSQASTVQQGDSQLRPTPATDIEQADGVSTQRPNELFVLFAFQGARLGLEVAEIDADENVNDQRFFHHLRTRYREKIGVFRYWLSPWRLNHCDLALFEKVQRNRLLFTKNDLPTDERYKYSPRPPKARLPHHIMPHHFEAALRSPCKLRCLLTSIHNCVEPPAGRKYLERIPKRQHCLQLMEDEPEEAWGLRACFALNFVRVMLYHCLVMVGSLVFWIWWQYNHPGDFQNASIPFMATVTTIAVIWNSVATVNNFK